MARNLQLIHLISSNRFGEAQRYALDICSHFRQHGWEVTAVTRDAKAVDGRFHAAGITLRHCPLRGFLDPTSAMVLAGMLRDIPRDGAVIHVHRYRDAFTALLAKRFAKRPDIRVVSTRHAVRRGRTSWMFRRIYNKINAHIFVSETARQAFFVPWGGMGGSPVNPKTVHVLHNSLRLNDFVPRPEPEKGPVIAVYQGPLVAGKGIEAVIDALVSLRDLKMRLRISGFGIPDYLDLLRRRAMTRGVMEMIDWNVSPEVSVDAVADAHFAVLPSMEREAFGLANLRVMACGRPQICTVGGAQAEYLEDGVTALFVPPADGGALAEAMRRLATSPQLRHHLGETARNRFEKSLSWDVFARRLEKIYNDLFV